MTPTQRRFAVMGDNIFKTANRLCTNQRLCRLLKYSVRDPFSKDLPDVDGDLLLNKQIVIVPKIPDADIEKVSCVVARFDQYVRNPMNAEFKISSLRFDIACPYDEWLLDDNSLRPYLLMEEIDTLFNQAKLAGIGNLEFSRMDSLVLSPQIGGYTMKYTINDFN